MSADEESPESRTPEDAERRPVTAPTATDESEGGGTEAAAATPPQAAPPPAPAMRDRPPAAPVERFYPGPILIGQAPARPDRWRTPAAGAPQYLAFACAAVALFGGWAAFHDEGVGIGLALTGIAAMAVPMAVGGREGLAVRLPGAVLVAGLWSVAAVRDAGWIVALCALTALLLTPLVLAPPSRFSGVLSALLGHLGGLAGAFRWTNRGFRRPDEAGNTMRNLRVGAITAGLLVVFGGLFAAADSGFAAIAANLVPEVDPFTLFARTLLSVLLFGLLLLWAYMSVARPRFDPEAPSEPRPASRFEVAVPLGALNLLFAAFIALQARTLYGGDDYVMETAGLTMAEYARSGFWQLSVVAVLALAVIAVAAWKAPRRTRADRWVARILLGGLCVMSLAVVASAMFRMSRYFETFGLTRLRVWVFTVEIWLAVLFVLVLACCWKLRATWLPRVVLASGALTLLGLAAADPDALIARYNIDHEHRLDLAYLQGLSDDAVPELMELSGEDRECVLGSFARERGERPLMAWNLGRQRADGLLAHWEGGREPCLPSRVYEDFDRSDGTDTASEDLDPTAAEGDGFFHWDTCDRYDLAGVTELFGTSAKGDRGVVPDDPSQYAEALDPALDRGDRVLHCGYYGPGMDYLMVETHRWPAAAEAEDGVRFMQADREESGAYSVAPFASGGPAGYIATQDSATGTYEYAAAVDETVVVVVSLSGSVFGAEAEAVCADLVEQTRALYSASA